MTDKTTAEQMEDLRRAWHELLRTLCPHALGWSYNAYRKRRVCRLCGKQQRLAGQSGKWMDSAPLEPTTLEKPQ